MAYQSLCESRWAKSHAFLLFNFTLGLSVLKPKVMKTFFIISALTFAGFISPLNAQYIPRQGWIEPTDLDFTMKVLLEKDRRYKENFNKIESLNKEISLLIKVQSKQGFSESQWAYIKSYTDAIEKINKSNYDFGKASIAQSVLNYLQQFYDEIYSW